MTPNQHQGNKKTPEAEALRKRYSDAYRLANANERLGSTHQTLAMLLGILAIVGAIITIATLKSVPAAVGVGFIGLLLAANLNGAGVQISAHGQLLKANIDSAINTSPFLSNEQKAAIMSLSSGSGSEHTTLANSEAADDSEIYMRFFYTDDRPLTLRTLETNLKQLNPEFAIDHILIGSSETGTLKMGIDTLGELEINRHGGEAFDDDIREFKKVIQGIQHPNKGVVTDLLNNTNSIVLLKLHSDAREKEDVQKRVEPLWEWLFSNSAGLLHIDNDGFYKGTELIFELD